MNTDRMHYQAYMLRLWQVRVGDRLVWRASLEIPGVEGRMGFSDLESLFAHLREQLGGYSTLEPVKNISQGES
jgi:hypothetical protein